MKIKLTEAEKLSNTILQSLGFTEKEAKLSTENFIEGEITGKKSHGLVRIAWVKKLVESGKISTKNEEIEIQKETAVSLLINGKDKTGFYVVNEVLGRGLDKVKGSGICIVGTTNTAPSSGLIGFYARKAAEKDIILIGFNNSSGGLIPYGSINQMFGTNPLTVGIPTNKTPIVLDMASSKITWGDLLVAKAEGKKVENNVALDGEGNVTTDPERAMEGGLLPIAEHKGSGLAFIVEILGGALTGSRVGNNVEGGWGSLFILIDPNIIRPVDEFKEDIASMIDELKSSDKMEGIEEIYYPGERSQELRTECIESGEFEINEDLYKSLKELIND